MKLIPAGSGQPVAALFLPQVTPDDAYRRVVAAGGYVLRPAGLPSMFIARSDNPDFTAALYRMGALLVADADGARGCTDQTPGDSR